VVGKLSSTAAGSLSLLLLLSFAILAFRCDEERNNDFVFMIFSIPFTITPERSELNLGDL